ncbi:MAG: VOC family protein [Variibacter sp.]|nr:VOC family protein [Variibacter sp.]
MIKARRLGHITFRTPDISRQIAYYEDVIGLGLAARAGGRAYLATETGQLSVVLEEGAQEECTHLAFEVAEGDLTAAPALLAAHGLSSRESSDPLPGIAKTVSFTDCKGTTIELFSGWRAVKPAAASSGARPVKLGHVAFMVTSPQETVDFYAATMGFKVADWIEDWFAFMRCSPDHHTVNFVRAPATGMHHLAFELRDAAHLHRACDLLGQHRIDLLWGPVRHGPGHNVATYHRNPDGQLVELFIDMDEMVDEELGYYEPRPWHRDSPQRPKVWTGLPRDVWGLPPLPEFNRDVQLGGRASLPRRT